MKTKIIFLIFLTFIFATFNVVKFFPDGKLHLVFCDVGQGDAAYIRGPKGSDIIIDGGPNEKVLTCLGEKMPFWDRTIELMILSHPQADHLVGLTEILKRYTVLQIIDSSANNNSQIEKLWDRLIKEKRIRSVLAKQGIKVKVDVNVILEIIWPASDFKAADVNGLSTVFFLSFGRFSALFTGDLDAESLDRLSSNSPTSLTSLTSPTSLIPPIPPTVLKIPHHGSKNSNSQNFYELFRPRLAVISVGKNSYGHPHPETLQLLDSLGIKFLRTDQNGTIEIISDGQNWFLSADFFK